MFKEDKTVSLGLSGLSIVLIIIVWTIAAIRIDNIYIMPRPDSVLKAFLQLLTELNTYIIVSLTFIRLFISISIAAIAGLLFGLLAGIRYQIAALLKPIVVTLRTVPVITIIIIVLILYGNEVSLYIISFLLLFPIIYQAVYEGVKNIDSKLKDALILETNPYSLHAMTQFFFPLSLSYFKTALLQSAGLGIKVLVVAEFIAQTKNSIGWELNFHRINLEYDIVFAWTIILIIIVLAIEYFVNAYVKYQND